MNTKDLVYIALFAAITAALGLIPSIGVPIIEAPISTQSLGAMLSGSILGAKRGALSQILFLVMISLGLPFLGGGYGGIGCFLGASGGFLLGWPAGALVIGILFEKNWHSLSNNTAFVYITIGGIIVIYITGVLWIHLILGVAIKAALLGIMIFIPGDIFKAIIATTVSMTVRRSHPIINSIKAYK